MLLEHLKTRIGALTVQKSPYRRAKRHVCKAEDYTFVDQSKRITVKKKRGSSWWTKEHWEYSTRVFRNEPR